MYLLERAQCLTDLTAWHRSVADRGGCVVLLGGEAGIGKTSLLQAFSKMHSKSRILWGCCDALQTPQPLAPLHDIARQTSGALALAFQAGASRDSIFRAALGELDSTDTVVIFEDMHWADEATLDLIKYLGRRIERSRAMIIITYRDDEVGARHPLRFVMGDLPRMSTRRLTLAPLTERAVEELARSAERPSRGVYRITQGNPLFVSEVLASGSDLVPVSVRDAVLARTARLSPAARDLSEFVSVVPSKTEAWLLSQAGILNEAAQEECLSMGFVRHDDGALSYRHELVRRAVESSLSSLRQRQLHATALQILATRPDTPVARLAHHAHGAGNAAEVLRLAPIAAAQAAAVGAHREAASHLWAAVRHCGTLSAEAQASLHDQLSYECHLIDEIDRAIAERVAALDIWRACGDRRKEGDALRWLSRLSWFAGRRAEAERYAQRAIATLESLAPGHELAMAYSNRSQLEMLAHQTDSAIHWANRAISIAERLGNKEILSHALNNLGTARHSSGDADGWADLARSLELALDGGYQEHVARAYTNLSTQAISSRQYARASGILDKGVTYCQENDLDSWRIYMLACRARAKFDTCEWLGAAEDAQEVLRHANVSPISRIPALTIVGHLRVRRGDPDADSPLNEATALATPTAELQRLAPVAVAQAEAMWLKDEVNGVIGRLQESFELAEQRREPWIKGEIAAWLWRARGIQRVPEGIAKPYALEIAGYWREAADAWSEIGCAYEHALVLGWYGGEGEQRAALSIFAHLGAAPAVEALRRRMRSLGIRGIPRGVRKSTGVHPFGLTRREAHILALMCDGLRNTAIAKRVHLSPRTVDHHVSAVLAKLGVHTRGEAVAIARRLLQESAT